MRLWRRSLCAPVVVVDAVTGRYRTSEPPPAAPLPALRGNTAFKWGDRQWIMVLSPLPADRARLSSLLFHEAWHGHQEALGFPANTAVAGHLDDPVARYLLRLEWLALERALRSAGAERRRHVAQALAFRSRRISGNASAGTSEAELMRHEGLAAYTGVAASGRPLERALAELREAPGKPSLGRNFAYASGPAWGLLLDALRPRWKRQRLPGDLAAMMPVAAAPVARADDYGGSAILAEEMLAAERRRRLVAEAEAATAVRSGLRLPLSQMSMDFDPNRVSTASDGGSIYHRITLSDRWGRVRIDGVGLRMLPDFSAAYAPWPLPDGALEIARGWQVRAHPGGGAELVGPAK